MCQLQEGWEPGHPPHQELARAGSRPGTHVLSSVGLVGRKHSAGAGGVLQGHGDRDRCLGGNLGPAVRAKLRRPPHSKACPVSHAPPGSPRSQEEGPAGGAGEAGPNRRGASAQVDLT